MLRKLRRVALNLWENWRDPGWWQRLLIRKLCSHGPPGVRIVDEDWDSLIILDACRYDFFRAFYREAGLRGRLEYRISAGTDTRSFLRENFSYGSFKDIVYVTANPFVDLYFKDVFYDVISVWDFGWDSRHGTVLPSTMYRYSIVAAALYPEKRLIIHFMQPHYPYLALKGLTQSYLEHLRSSALSGREPRPKLRFYPHKIYDVELNIRLPKRVLVRAYIANLRLVLRYVSRLVNFLPGRTIITSDHGEAFGDRVCRLLPIRVYGHFPWVRVPSLIYVPWLVVEERDKEDVDIREEIRRLGLGRELLRWRARRASRRVR